MDIIPTFFATVIPINLLLFIHHIYYSHNYVANQTEKLYYYLTAMIPLAPGVIYSFTLIDYFTQNGDPYYDHRFLQVFFKTWVISNPLLLINLGRLMNISLEKYLAIMFADIGIYLLGYLSYKTQDINTFWATFFLASALFLLILFTLLRAYMNHKTPEGMSHMIPLYKFTSKFIISTWGLYPTIFLLYKTSIITLTETSIAYIVLDFLTKSVFSSIIIVYHRHLNRRKSMVDFATRRVIPLETILEVSNEYSTESTSHSQKTSVSVAESEVSHHTQK